MTYSTKLMSCLKVQHPILCAPMGAVSSPELVAGVSNSGGLGLLGLTWLPDIEQIIARTQKLTTKPFGVNFVVSQCDLEPKLDMCLGLGIQLFSFSWGFADKYVERIKKHGGVVMQTVGNVDDAEAAASFADIIVLQGMESGGHVLSQVSTMCLVPEVRRRLPDALLVAAGGIACGRGILAAQILGADGVMIGTRFIATDEAFAHQRYKQAIVKAKSHETHIGQFFDRVWAGADHRVLKTATTEQFLKGKADKTAVKGKRPDGSPIYLNDSTLATPEMNGNIDQFALYAGQTVGQITNIGPINSVFADVVSEYENAKRLL